MADILPQQRLFLEMLMMSGDFAVQDDEKYEILNRTLKECQEKRWVRVSTFGADFNKVSITAAGRTAAKVN
jgi:hypothetical protein